MLGHSNGHDLALAVHLNRNLHRPEAGHLVGLRTAISRSRSLLERLIDRVAGQRRTGLHINLSGGDILTNQSVKHRGIGNQIRTKARSLVMLGHGNGHDLALAINLDRNLHRSKAVHVVNIGSASVSSDLFSRGFFRTGSRGKDRFLITRLRSNAKLTLGVREDLRHRADKRGGRHRRAADGIDVIIQGIRISRNRNELLHKGSLADPAAKTSGLLQRADISLRHPAFGAHAERDRDRAAVALRIGDERIAGRLAGRLVLAHKHLGDRTAFFKALDLLDLLIVAARKHLAQRSLLRRNLLFRDRALRHFIGDSQANSRDEREDEKTNSEFHDITHSSLPPQSSWKASRAQSAGTPHSSAG